MSDSPPPNQAPPTAPIPTAPHAPDTEVLQQTTLFLNWITDEIHPQYGGGMTFDREDTVYWLGRFSAVSAEVAAKEPDLHLRYIKVKNLLLHEYRVYGKRGQFRTRILPKSNVNPGLQVATQGKSAAGALKQLPPRALADNLGPVLECGIDDLRLMLLWDVNVDAAQARIREHSERGYTWVHVLAHDWSIGLSKNAPGHLNRMVAITKYVFQTGGRVHWTLVGDRTGGLEKVNLISQFVRDATRALKECAYGVALIQIAAHRQGMPDADLDTLVREGKANLPTTLFSTTEADSLEHGESLTGEIVVAALDGRPNLGEGPLRIWRQPWTWARFPRPWVARGTGGPDYPFRDSPGNPEVLRSHRLAAFAAGACVSIYQSTAGANGEDFRLAPSYARSGATVVLPPVSRSAIVPGELPNGEVPSDEEQYLSLPLDQRLLIAGTGALALLSRKLPKVGLSEVDTCYYHLIGQTSDIHLKVHKAGTVVAFNPENWTELFSAVLDPEKSLALPLPRHAKFLADTWLVVTP